MFPKTLNNGEAPCSQSTGWQCCKGSDGNTFDGVLLLAKILPSVIHTKVVLSRNPSAAMIPLSKEVVVPREPMTVSID